MLDKDAILDRWAAREAARDIAISVGLTDRNGYKRLLNIIAYARSQHDPRAAFRNGSEKKGRPSLGDPAKARQRKVGRDGAALKGWWFGAETVWATRLGFGSVDCQRIPISVSCIPRRVVSQTVTSTPRKTDAHRSFADAFADLAGRQDRTARSGDTETKPQKST